MDNLGIEMILGTLIPLFILSYHRTKTVQTWQVFASVLVLTGIMTMRYIVIIGGQSFPVQLM